MNLTLSESGSLNSLNTLAASTPGEWNEIWKADQKASRSSGHGRECWEAWDDMESAQQYWENVSARDTGNGRVADLLGMIDEGWKILDIGAGPGNLSIPMAGKAAWVTAVEPARGMASILHSNIEKGNIGNMDIVPKRWDDVECSRDLKDGYDLVIASYSFGMLDLQDSIRKILKAARQEVVFYWHAGPQAWDVDAEILWPLLHKRNFSPIPKSNIIFNMLYAMGIYPDIRSIPDSYRMSFDNMDNALFQYSSRFNVEKDDIEMNKLLRKYLEENLVQEDGKLYQRAQNTGMRISFNVKTL